MAKSKDVNDPESVTAFIQKQDPAFADLLEKVRQLILKSDKEVGEQIKWNSPAFFYTGDMKPFDPKEYKRDIAVFNARKGVLLLIFPTGAIIRENTRILEGDYKDGRRMITFKDQGDVKSKGKDLQAIVKEWLSLVEK